jgi:hypothetical protein
LKKKLRLAIFGSSALVVLTRLQYLFFCVLPPAEDEPVPVGQGGRLDAADLALVESFFAALTATSGDFTDSFVALTAFVTDLHHHLQQGMLGYATGLFWLSVESMPVLHSTNDTVK